MCCTKSNEQKKGNTMNEALKAKLDEARERMNSQQAGINADRKNDDRATMRFEIIATLELSDSRFFILEASRGPAGSRYRNPGNR